MLDRRQAAHALSLPTRSPQPPVAWTFLVIRVTRAVFRTSSKIRAMAPAVSSSLILLLTQHVQAHAATPWTSLHVAYHIPAHSVTQRNISRFALTQMNGSTRHEMTDSAMLKSVEPLIAGI